MVGGGVASELVEWPVVNYHLLVVVLGEQDLRRVDPVFDLMADEQGLQGRRRATANDKAGTDNDMSKDGLTTVSKLNRYRHAQT